MTISLLHVSQPTTYGLARYVTEVARGWRVTVASPTDGPLASACRSVGAEHIAWPAIRSPGPGSVREARRLRSIVHDVAPDAVVLHSSKAGLAGRLAVRGRRPTIFIPHAWSFLHGGPPTRVAARVWERVATRWTDTLLCVSESERMIGERARVTGQYVVVPNAVDLEKYSPVAPGQRGALRRALGLSDAPLAVSVGRLTRQKGQDILLAAWPSILERVPDARLVLVGDGPLRAELSSRAGPAVQFAGERDDVVDWLRAADVVVQPSRWEGLSFVALETIACGRSLVASDVAGMREVIGDDAGTVVAPGDAAALACAVALRLGEPERAEREGRRARARAALFDLRSWGEALARVVTDAVARRGEQSAR